MNINSEYIQKKEFHTAFKGYSMEEVDKFLDILAVEFERITKKNKELQDSLDKVKYEGDTKEEADVNTLVSEVLVSAHKVADEIKKKAEADAKEVIQNKKDIEEKQLKNLLKEKKELEDKVKFIGDFYGDFLIKIKKDIGDFNLKIKDIENGFKTEEIIDSPKPEIESSINIKTDILESSFTEADEEKVMGNSKEDNKKEGLHSLDEEIDENIAPEIKRLSNEDEEKKIREVIESEDTVENNDRETYKEIKKEKKIFDEYEEERITKERKKIDIGNPDIINEFFGNNDDRKY